MKALLSILLLVSFCLPHVALVDLPETKKLVKENFILVLLVKGHKALDVYHPPVITGSPFYVLINPDGTIVKAADTFGNPGSGLKAVKELIALPSL